MMSPSSFSHRLCTWAAALPLLVLSGAALGQVPPAERAALIQLYNATGGPRWTHQDNWLGPEGTESTWYGVGVDPYTHTVTGIWTWGNNLTGTLPDIWAGFSNLQALNLSENDLTGPLPAGLSKNWGLYNVDLHKNRFTGPIPSEWRNLRFLTYLDLSDNLLSGELPAFFADLPHLSWVMVTANGFWGQVPRSYCAKGAGFQLRMDGNALHAEDPALRAYLDNYSWVVWEDYQLKPPGAPSVYPVAPGKVEVGWTPVDMGAFTGGYRIYQGSLPGGPYQLIAELPSNASSYAAEGLSASSPVYFRVRSFRDAWGVFGPGIESEPGPELVARPSGELSVDAQADQPVKLLSEPFAFSTQVSGGTGALTYSWDFGDGATAIGATATHLYASPATYTFTVTVTDGIGAKASASGWVTPYPPPTVTAGAEAGSQAGQYTFHAQVTDGAPPYTYRWDFGDGGTSQWPSPVVYTYGAPGTYTWCVQVRDSTGNVGSACGTASYDMDPALAASASPAWGAAPLPVHFTAQAIGGTPPLTVDWDFGDGSPTATGLQADHTYAEAWSYRWRARLTDAVGREVVASGTVMVGMPRITGATAKTSPAFSLRVAGEGFRSGCTLLINGVPVPKTVYKSTTLVVAQGAGLSDRVPRGDAVMIQVTDPVTGLISQAFTFTRTMLKGPVDRTARATPARASGG